MDRTPEFLLWLHLDTMRRVRPYAFGVSVNHNEFVST
jgi:hypothetical protein